MNLIIYYKWKPHFKKAKPRNKLGESTHSHYDYKSTNDNYNNYLKPQHSSKDYNIPPTQGKQISFVIFVREKATKLFNAEIEGKKIFVRI